MERLFVPACDTTTPRKDITPLIIDVLPLVVKNLSAAGDYRAFRLTCHLWNHSTAENMHLLKDTLWSLQSRSLDRVPQPVFDSLPCRLFWCNRVPFRNTILERTCRITGHLIEFRLKELSLERFHRMSDSLWAVSATHECIILSENGDRILSFFNFSRWRFGVLHTQMMYDGSLQVRYFLEKHKHPPVFSETSTWKSVNQCVLDLIADCTLFEHNFDDDDIVSLEIAENNPRAQQSINLWLAAYNAKLEAERLAQL